MPHLYDNKYCFIRDLGEGGFGKVFLAKEETSNRFVAIKQLLKLDEAKQAWIVHEIQQLSKLNHQHIVTYYHHFIQDNLLYIVMEYCSKGSLREICSLVTVSPTSIMQWIIALADTLQYMHDQKIIHHDIKPDNILFTENGEFNFKVHHLK